MFFLLIIFWVLAKSTVLCFSLKAGRSAMTSFLDICYGYDAKCDKNHLVLFGREYFWYGANMALWHIKRLL